MVRLIQDCDCAYCTGGDPSPKGTFGGSLCTCSCHDRKAPEKNIFSRVGEPCPKCAELEKRCAMLESDCTKRFEQAMSNGEALRVLKGKLREVVEKMKAQSIAYGKNATYLVNTNNLTASSAVGHKKMAMDLAIEMLQEIID